MTANDILEYEFEHVAVATGAEWRRDGVARWHTHPVPADPGAEVLTPDDVMSGTMPSGREVVLYDDDHFYLGGVLAELLARQGHVVHLVTPAPQVSAWTVNTMEQVRVHRRLAQAGVHLHLSRAVTRVEADHVRVTCTYTGAEEEVPAAGVVMVTARILREALLLELQEAAARQGRLITVRGIGDAWAPSTIAAAVW
jgi:dimethylamine/trimethylamine dehydrogenase